MKLFLLVFAIFLAARPAGAAPVIPVIISSGAISVTDTTAKLRAVVNPGGADTTVQFHLALTSGSVTVATTPQTVSGTTVTSGTTTPELISGLSPKSQYTLIVTASNSAGASLSSTTSFTTSNKPPVALNATLLLSGTVGTIDLGKTHTISDPYKYPLTVTANSGQFGTVAVTGSSLSYTLTPGNYYMGGDQFTYSVRDALGATDTGTIFVDGGLLYSTLATTGTGASATVPAWDPALTFASVGVPSVSASGKVAFYALLKWSAGTIGVIVEGYPGNLMTVARQDQSIYNMWGDYIVSLGDPVMDSHNHVAFIAKLGGPGIVRGQNDIGFFTDAPDATLRLVKQTGSAKTASIQGLSMQQTTVSGTTLAEEVIYEQILSAGHKSQISSLIVPTVSSTLAVAEHILVQVDVTKVKNQVVRSFDAFGSFPYVTGQARAYVTPGTITVQTLFAGGSSAIVDASTTSGSSFQTVAASGSAVDSKTIPGAKWVSFGTPVGNTSLSALAFRGVCKTSSSAVPETGIFVRSGTGFEPVALIGGTATGSTGAPLSGVTYVALSDPVMDSDAGSIAFLGTARNKAVAFSGIWFTGTSGEPALVAATGTAAFLPASASLTAFISLALPPDANGPVFVALLNKFGKPSTGLFAVNSAGDVELLVQTGVTQFGTTKQGKPITASAIDVLGTGLAPNYRGNSSSFNGNQVITYRAELSDGTQSIQAVHP